MHQSRDECDLFFDGVKQWLFHLLGEIPACFVVDDISHRQNLSTRVAVHRNFGSKFPLVSCLSLLRVSIYFSNNVEYVSAFLL